MYFIHAVSHHITGMVPAFLAGATGSNPDQIHSVILGSAESEHISVVGRFPNANTVPIPQDHEVGSAFEDTQGHAVFHVGWEIRLNDPWSRHARRTRWRARGVPSDDGH